MIFGFVFCYFFKDLSKANLFNLSLVFYLMAEDSRGFFFFIC